MDFVNKYRYQDLVYLVLEAEQNNIEPKGMKSE